MRITLVQSLREGEEGYLFLTPGEVCDYTFIKRFVCGLYDAAGNLIDEGLVHKFEFQGVAYDPYNAEQLTQQLEEEGGIPRHLFPQTMKHFVEPTGEFERLLISGKLHHQGHPVMDWQIGNLQFKHDASGNKRPMKPGPHDFRKVDGPVALIMAVGLHTSGGYQESAYDNPGEGEIYL
ncbi:terminase TerL endonuclease subunit [Planctomicrobium sp. SH661]|uniref:terminase TerL endonuclease subunit n=1 Tax=Planctomicrobium sp. SH661 TaxID=3448124 RepID=UPI003F5B55E8